jgi:hypothetical protein
MPDSSICQSEVYPAATATGLSGQSLIALHDLPAGTAIARFDGPRMPYSEVPEEEKRYALLFGDDWLIPRTSARFINHSCDPNCEVYEDLTVVTVRAVKQGDELTFSYNLVDPEDFRQAPETYFWDPCWTFQCQCGSDSCIGLINGYRFEHLIHEPHRQP